MGNNGKIAHYKNGNWSGIESVIDLSIHDVNGFTNQFTGKPEILSVADDPNFLEEVQVISITENNTTSSHCQFLILPKYLGKAAGEQI